MKNLLIASFDLEVGGVERSLLSMLNSFDYTNHQVDLMLYSHTGDFMNLLPEEPRLLAESRAYRTFRMSIGQTLRTGHIPLALSRLMAKYKASKDKSPESGYKQMQYMWAYALPFLPEIKKKYDVAISYLWPHYFVAEKVEAATKIAWIHTDFSTVETDTEMDIRMWNRFDYIIAVSEECKNAFIRKYPILKRKVSVMENITSPDFVRGLAEEEMINPMVADHRFKLITVARLSHAKGIDNAVRALSLLKKRGYDNIVWYIVGYGGDEANIKTLIQQEGLENDFILLGKRLNPYPFIKAADLYVQPSRYEGKAVTVGEAQILAKPVLITDYPTAPSQVRNGMDGCICKISAEGIADGIEMLYHDSKLRHQLSANCRQSDYRNNHELEKLYQLG